MTSIPSTRISARQGDITEFEGDAIVNAANSPLTGGGGVDGAIHRAGGLVILEECQAWVAVHGPLPTGQAMATGGGDLPVRTVIHTVGPIWAEHDSHTARLLLASCYQASLDVAKRHGCVRVAFPGISTGVYGYPKDEAAEVAVEAVTRWLSADDSLDEVVFVCFSEENLEIYSRLLGA
ncbi:MAG TPA: O-acetyl-ADP-ribose deacetylase [Acidimicrobiia bacterium]|nr:O-acetyl-ADP-ribose deacetylase [Acidimicrobiia bacterium]